MRSVSWYCLPLQVLQDLIRATMSIPNMRRVVALLSVVPEPKVTTLLTEIVESIAVRCREELMAIAAESDTDTDSSGLDVGDISISVGDGTSAGMDGEIQQDVLSLHNLCLEKLWAWACDASSVPDAVSIKCIPKIEAILALGHSYAVVSEAGVRFPWAMQWERTLPLLEGALQTVTDRTSTTLALRTIRAALLVWMKDESDAMPVTNPDGSGQPLLPFGFYPVRHLVAEYLCKQYHLLDQVVSVTISVKESFVHATRHILEEARTQHLEVPTVCRNFSTGSTVSVDEGDDAAVELNAEQHATLNGFVVPGTRSGYKEQLECCFDFLHFLVRCSPKIRLSFGSIEAIWNAILMRAVTPQERDAVYSFLTRLIIHRSTQLPANITGIANGGGDDTHTSVAAVTFEAAAEESKGGEAERASHDEATYAAGDAVALDKASPSSDMLSGMKEFYRASFCSPQTVTRIFHELLCTEKFVGGYQFNSCALACVEKFYRWVGAANGTIVELPVSE